MFVLSSDDQEDIFTVSFVCFLSLRMIPSAAIKITTNAIRAKAGMVTTPNIFQSISVQGLPGAQATTFREFIH